MKTLLKLTALAEAATGLTLLAYPPIRSARVVRRGRHWCGHTHEPHRWHRIVGFRCRLLAKRYARPACHGMLTYSVVVTLYLVMVGAGLLLWPAVLVHAVLAVLFIRELRRA